MLNFYNTSVRIIGLSLINKDVKKLSLPIFNSLTDNRVSGQKHRKTEQREKDLLLFLRARRFPCSTRKFRFANPLEGSSTQHDAIEEKTQNKEVIKK
jgi:hypothetical protein